MAEGAPRCSIERHDKSDSRIDVFWSEEEENFKRIISREIGLILQDSELIQRHESR
ncbi:hypothetical protein C5S39_01390 [Candidatus Methanophagaceae archaeon]|nr:hypothetical protein C5S39_01390 [Methanophagales archaeon]